MPVRIGQEGRRLFGIVSIPPSEDPKLCIVMLNAGLQNRAGPHRLYWKFAREATRQGYAVLRLDLAGVGDSEAENSATHFDTHKKEDVQTAVDHVREIWPDCRIVLLGLCAGSRVAFKAAAPNSDIDGVVAWSTTIITAAQNSPQSPYEPADRMSEYVVSQNIRGIKNFFLRLRFINPFWWRNKLSNMGSVTDEVRVKFRAVRRLLFGMDSSAASNEFLDSVDTYLKQGRSVLFVYGERDTRPLAEFRQRFAGVAEVGGGNSRLVVVPHGTHTFSSLAAQSDVIRHTLEWLASRYTK